MLGKILQCQRSENSITLSEWKWIEIQLQTFSIHKVSSDESLKFRLTLHLVIDDYKIFFMTAIVRNIQ